MQFFDLNIAYLEGEKSIPNESSKKQNRLRLIIKAMELGYTGIAYNRTIKGVMSESDRCAIPPFPLSTLLKVAPSLSSVVSFHRGLVGVPEKTPFRQYTRLTVVVETSAQASTLNSGNPVLKTYDLVAVRPLNQNCFDQACQSSQVDLISIDFADKLPFRLKLRMVKVAIARGVFFEISYSGLMEDAQSRRQLISNAKLLIEWTRGKSLIISSAASSVLEFRGPNDVSNLSSLLGLSKECAKAAISKNCRLLIANALRKKQFYREAIRVEVMPSGAQTDLNKPWIFDDIDWDPVSSGEGDLCLDDMAKSFANSGKVSQTVKAIDFASIVDCGQSNGLQVKDTGFTVENKVYQFSNIMDFASKNFGASKDSEKLQKKPVSFSSHQSDQTSNASEISQQRVLADSFVHGDPLVERNGSDFLVQGEGEEVTEELGQKGEYHNDGEAGTNDHFVADTMMEVDSSPGGTSSDDFVVAKSVLPDNVSVATEKQVDDSSRADSQSIIEIKSGPPKVNRLVSDQVYGFSFKRLLQNQFKKKSRKSAYKKR